MANECVDREELEKARDTLDKEMEKLMPITSRTKCLNLKRKKFPSHRWFDERDREYQQCRLKVCKRIHSLCTNVYSRPNTVKSSCTSRTSHSDKSGKSNALSEASNSSARSSRLKAEPMPQNSSGDEVP